MVIVNNPSAATFTPPLSSPPQLSYSTGALHNIASERVCGQVIDKTKLFLIRKEILRSTEKFGKFNYRLHNQKGNPLDYGCQIFGGEANS